MAKRDSFKRTLRLVYATVKCRNLTAKSVSNPAIMGVEYRDSWIIVRGKFVRKQTESKNHFRGVDSKKEVNFHAYTIYVKWLKSTENLPKFLAIGKQGKVSLGTLFENNTIYTIK